VPILFHMVLGVIIVTTGGTSPRRYPCTCNWMQVLQRLLRPSQAMEVS